MSPIGLERQRAITLPYGYPASTDNPTEIWFFEGPNDDLLTHEVGHVIDYRQLAPEISEGIRAIFEKKRPRFIYGGQPVTDYSAGSGYAAEYVAETFHMAIDVIRSITDSSKQEERLQRLETRFPGISLWVKYIRDNLNTAAIAQGGKTPWSKPR
jgi:hypothetical protein